MASASRRYRRANGMKESTVKKAIESKTPLNSLYALIPQDRRKALDHFARCLGMNPAKLKEAMVNEQNNNMK